MSLSCLCLAPNVLNVCVCVRACVIKRVSQRQNGDYFAYRRSGPENECSLSVQSSTLFDSVNSRVAHLNELETMQSKLCHDGVLV